MFLVFCFRFKGICISLIGVSSDVLLSIGLPQFLQNLEPSFSSFPHCGQNIFQSPFYENKKTTHPVISEIDIFNHRLRNVIAKIIAAIKTKIPPMIGAFPDNKLSTGIFLSTIGGGGGGL